MKDEEVDRALAFVREHGIVLAAARGPVPNLVETIAGEPVRGSWWSHPKAHAIFRVLEAVYGSRQVLVCRLVNGKVTLVHRRLWPALVRVADRLPRSGLAAVREEHTADGSHRVVRTAFPRWVPGEVLRRGRRITIEEAERALGRSVDLLARPPARRRPRPRGRREPR